MVRLFKEMIAICKRNQLNILLFQIEPALKENNFFKQPIQIMLVGNYVSIMHFVNQIAHLPWTVTVGNFSLKTILDNQNNLYSAQFKFYIYYHPNQSISRNTRR